MTLSLNLPVYLDFESSESFLHHRQSVYPWIKKESFDIVNMRRFKETCGQRRGGRDRMQPRTGSGDRPMRSQRDENFGYKDLRLLTRWQWSVMVTASNRATSPPVRRIARSFTRHYLDCYVRARSTRARNISSPSWTSLERVTRKICLVHGGKPWYGRAWCTVRALATGCEWNSAAAIRMRGRTGVSFIFFFGFWRTARCASDSSCFFFLFFPS